MDRAAQGFIEGDRFPTRLYRSSRSRWRRFYSATADFGDLGECTCWQWSPRMSC